MKKTSLRFKLAIGGIILLMTPITLISGFSAVTPSNAVPDLSMQQSVLLARSLAQKVHDVLADGMTMASSIAVKESVVGAAAKVGQVGATGAVTEIATANQYLSKVMKECSGGYGGFALLDANGVVFAGQGGIGAGLDASAREAFKTAKTGKVGVGNPFRSERTGEIVAQICAPILSDRGEFIGAVSSLIRMGALFNHIGSVKMGETGYAFMVDNKGQVIAHPRKDLVLRMNLTAQANLNNLGRGMIAQKTGSEFYTDQGEKRHIAFTPVKQAGWSVGFTQTTNELIATSRSIGYFTGSMGIAALLLVLAILTMPSRRLTDPIGRVVNGLKAGAVQVASTPSRLSSAS